MRFLILTLSVLLCGPVLADDLNCKNKVAAIYSPGPNWSQLQVILPKHSVFITDRLNSGEVEEGGPFMGEKGVTGGLMIYSSEDAAAVEKTVKQDPFITNGVAVYELRTWFKCVSAK